MAGPAHAAPDRDASHVMCGAHEPDLEGRAMTAELMVLAGLAEAPHPVHHHGDCPLCALVHAATLPAADGLARLAYAVAVRTGPADGLALTPPVTGPPVGLRAPPLSV